MSVIQCCCGGNCAVTFTGTITSVCSGVLLPGAPVAAYTVPGGVLIGTATADGSANYSITGVMPAGDTQVDIRMSGGSAPVVRYAVTTIRYTIVCGTNALGAFAAALATHYECTVTCDDTVGDVVSVYLPGGIPQFDGHLSFTGSAWVGTSIANAAGGFTAIYSWDGLNTVTLTNFHFGGLPGTNESGTAARFILDFCSPYYQAGFTGTLSGGHTWSFRLRDDFYP
jgi:hypothetical protein